MAIGTIRVKGFIRGGKLDVEIPSHVLDGEVTVEIAVHEPEPSAAALDDMLRFKAATAGEMLQAGVFGTGALDWATLPDSAEWVNEQRRQRQDERRAKWTAS